MRRFQFLRLLAAFATLLALTAHPAALQDEKTTARVTIAQSAGPPGGSVAVPIQLAAAEPGQVGSLTLQLRFPAAQLTFTKIEMGGLGEAVGAEAAVVAKEIAGETLLELTIAAPEKNGTRTPLPDGPIAHLLFKIASGLTPETVIPLKVHVAAGGARPGAGPVRVVARDGEIIVSNPSVIGCFFYMH